MNPDDWAIEHEWFPSWGDQFDEYPDEQSARAAIGSCEPECVLKHRNDFGDWSEVPR